MSVEERRRLLAALLDLAAPLDDLHQGLAELSWDSDVALVTLDARRVGDVLDRFLAGAITRETVEAWAEAVESREDVAFQDVAVADAVFTLANPALEGALTPERARLLRDALRGGG